MASYYRLRCESGVRLDTSCAELKQLKEEAATAADKAEEVSGYVHDQKNLDQLGRDLDTLHSLANELAQRGPTLGADMDAAVKKINDLNDGAHKVSAGRANCPPATPGWRPARTSSTTGAPAARRYARRPGSATSTPVWAGSRTARRH